MPLSRGEWENKLTFLHYFFCLCLCYRLSHLSSPLIPLFFSFSLSLRAHECEYMRMWVCMGEGIRVRKWWIIRVRREGEGAGGDGQNEEFLLSTFVISCCPHPQTLSVTLLLFLTMMSIVCLLFVSLFASIAGNKENDNSAQRSVSPRIAALQNPFPQSPFLVGCDLSATVYQLWHRHLACEWRSPAAASRHRG